MRLILPVFIFILCSITAEAQDSTVIDLKGNEIIEVDSIIITGNDITVNDVILRELTFSAGDEVDSVILAYNMERIYSLRIFNQVGYTLFQKNSIIFLNIIVEESWYIWPVPFAYRHDNDWEKISYGIDFRVFNFRGRNEVIWSRLGFGYDPEVSLLYSLPYLLRNENISMQFMLQYVTKSNRSLIAEALRGETFDQEWFVFEIILDKRLDLFNKISLQLAYQYVETPFFLKGINASKTKIDRFPSAALSYTFDSRDLYQFPREGYFFNTAFKQNGIFNDEINYQILQTDFRHYRRIIGDLHIKGRLKLRETFGGDAVPFYDYSYLGLGDRVRGHYFEQSEGHGLFFGSVELYHPIIKEIPIKFDLPLVPNRMTSFRFGIHTHLFFDTGFTKNRSEPYSLDKFFSGFGWGITFLTLPGGSMRFDLAFDEDYNTQFIIDTSVSF